MPRSRNVYTNHACQRFAERRPDLFPGTPPSRALIEASMEACYNQSHLVTRDEARELVGGHGKGGRRNLFFKAHLDPFPGVWVCGWSQGRRVTVITYLVLTGMEFGDEIEVAVQAMNAGTADLVS